jgi:hypothetical protein
MLESLLAVPSTVTVPLHATVLDLCFELAVTDVDFGTVEPGCSSPERYLQILNSCQTPMTITGIDIPQVETADFRLLDAPPLPLVLPGGAVTEVLVAYRPLGDGADLGMLRVHASELPGPIMGVLRGNGGPVDRQTDVFEGVGRASADILWVIDNSGSMGDDLQAVAENAAPFIDVAVDKDIDFRMAVTSTDMESGGLRGRIYPLDRLRQSLGAAMRRLDPWSTIEDLPPGNRTLKRQILKRYLVHGIQLAESEIVLTQGAVTALHLCLAAVTKPGDSVVTCAPQRTRRPAFLPARSEAV